MEVEIGTGSIVRGFSSKAAYKTSFLELDEGMVYHPGITAVKKGNEDSEVRDLLLEEHKSRMASYELKAFGPTAGGTGTAGYGMFPVYLDPRIIDLTRKYTPLVEMIPRVTNYGLTADYNEITAKGGGFTAQADAAMVERDDTEARQSSSIKYLYAVGRVLGPAQAAMPAYLLDSFTGQGNYGVPGSGFGNVSAPNAKQYEVLKKGRSMKELEESLIVNGDDSSDATQFDGFIAAQGTTNQLDKSTTALSYDDIDTIVQYAQDDSGHPSLGVCSTSVMKDVRKLLRDQFRYTPADMLGEALKYGIPQGVILETAAGAVPLIASQYMSNTSGSKQLFLLDMDSIEMRVLQDMTYEELAKTNDSEKFMLKIYETLIVRAPQFNAFVDNIL